MTKASPGFASVAPSATSEPDLRPMVRGGVTASVGRREGFALLARMVRSQAWNMAYLDMFQIFWIIAICPLEARIGLCV
jgi:hypothetical protein